MKKATSGGNESLERVSHHFFNKKLETLSRMKKAILGGNESTKHASCYFSSKRKRKKRGTKIVINGELEHKIKKVLSTSFAFTFLRVGNSESNVIISML